MENSQAARDFSTISPSALALLELKAQTDIPFAARAAALVSRLADVDRLDITSDTGLYWGRVLHFESRYHSINSLIETLTPGNILELSSGYNFRGLDLLQRSGIHYVDTDLPDLIAQKSVLVHELMKHVVPGRGSRLELQPLNVLDAAAFYGVMQHFGEGPVTIINEGLLMYLNDDEKTQLCRNIRGELELRGGCWITGDIYIRDPRYEQHLQSGDELGRLFKQHQIYDHMFNSEAAAEAFFNREGFVVDQVADIDESKLSAVARIMTETDGQTREELRRQAPPRKTWRLRVSGF
jgi:O-methyltransferase involved in polyketide biosynthesis